MKRILLLLLMGMTAAVLSHTAFSQSRQERLTGHVYYFAADSLKGRGAGSEDAAKAAAYIAHEFEAMGLKPYFEDWYMPFERHGGHYKNVVALLEGQDPDLKDEYIVIGAHYDHLGMRKGQVYNGADDNASGTAAVLEIARALQYERTQLRRSVLIAAFDAEELGLFGSSALAETLARDSVRVKVMMSVDMVGWYRQSGKLILEGVSTLKDGRRLLSTDALQIKLKSFETSVFTATDTQTFAEKGVPTLAVTTGLKSPYHKPEDDPDLIDYPGLDKVTGYLTDVTRKMATDPSLAASGRVAPKHRDRLKTFDVALEAFVGSASLSFPDAAFNGKSDLSYGGGLMVQYNIGSKQLFALRADALYLNSKARFPDEKDFFNSVLTYKDQRLVVPVQLVVQAPKGLAHFSLGGYYARRFGVDTPPAHSVNPNDAGLSVGFGVRLGHLGMGFTGLYSMKDLFAEKPRAHELTSLFRLAYYF